ncbi:MAG TPA: F0F1 ATP synthase subunit delta [Trebonia sp.]|jgi:F-type H+-transporting ATPase subunit delta|nr:F0F1 ATP synthase subunit delta [Trebonia sp.]
MRGASRASYAELRERLAASLTAAPVAQQTGDELFAVTRLLDSEHGLRRALSDTSKEGPEKTAVMQRLLHGRVSAVTEELAGAAAAEKWATSGEFADAIEQLAIESLTVAAQLGGSLDDLEDDLFRFGRVVAGQPALREALTGPADSVAKQSLLSDLLSRKVSAPSLALITQLLTHTRGRSPQAAIDLAAGIAAQRRQQLIAVVRVATDLTAAQRQRLVTALTHAYGRGVHLNVVHDPSVVGGMSVQIGDDLIDGTASTRLSEVQRKLAG